MKPALNDERGPRAPLLVVALGGNAISRHGDPESIDAQRQRARTTMEHLVPVVAEGGYRLVVTHGNGPQVGAALLRSELAAEAGELPRVPMDVADADTQGGMGYLIQEALGNALWESGLDIPVATVVTRVLVGAGDPAFSRPSKPVGRFYPDDLVDELRRRGWSLSQDPEGRGWRRVVPSPRPLEILEQPLIRELLRSGTIVVACGGGGIPVVMDEAGSTRGVEAVVDKDLASSLLAAELQASSLAILTDVERIHLDHGLPTARPLDVVDASSLEVLAAEGHFPAGSMGPKVEALIGFVTRGGSAAVVTSPELLAEALAGRAGTRVVPSSADALGYPPIESPTSSSKKTSST